jgi:hypothetical protein
MAAKLLVNVMPWFGDGNIHRMDRYLSNEPYVIAKQLDVMQRTQINGMPIAGIILTYQGPLAKFQHSTAMQMVVECGERDLLFALCLDPWIAKIGASGTTAPSTQNVINALNNPDVQAMLTAPAYLPEKYVLDFNTVPTNPTTNVAALAAAFPSLNFLQMNVGFSWISIDMSIANSDARNASAVANLKGQNANPKMKIPGICKEFNDAGQPTPVGVSLAAWTGTRDNTTSVWGGMPARVLDSQGGNFFYDQLAVTPESEYMGFITWNDYDERTEIESACSAQAGIQIAS